ncbi:MAG: molybdopterin-dependent oxidoreductase [Deltaproteobacteria bacterium]|nr:molybdopterin-dependent oxidoreductase [Deltaproteobacteria bacterium]
MKSDKNTKHTICYMCTAHCPMLVYISQKKVVKVKPATKQAGRGCLRWKAQIDFVYHPDRIKYPLVRVGKRGEGKFERITWDEAFDIVSSNLDRIKKNFGPHAVVFWISYTKEPRPYFQRFAHAFGSPNYCTESSSCASSAMLAVFVTYGNPYGFIPQFRKSEYKCKLIWGSSIKNSNPLQWPSYLEYRRKGGKIIVVDPLVTTLAKMADIHLQLRPGTDGALALGMMNVIFREKLHDAQFLEEWTVGFKELTSILECYTPDVVEKITGVSALKIRDAALTYALNKPSQIVLSPSSTTHHTNGFQNQRAIILLPVLTGNIDPLQPPPGNPKLNDITLFEKTSNMAPGIGSQRFPLWTNFWKEMQSNAIKDQIDSGNPYEIKALFGAGLDIQFFPNSLKFVESLKKLDFIVVTEYFHTHGTSLADVVLPIASWWERTGLFIDKFRNKMIIVEPVIEPIGECLSEWHIYSEIAKRLGFGSLFWNGDFKACVNYILEPTGIDYEHLKKYKEGIPIPRYEPARGFPTPSGKIEIFSSILQRYGYEPLPSYTEPQESPFTRPDLIENYPLVLTSGARVPFYTHSQFRNIKLLRMRMPDPLVDIHPLDAKARNIKSGDIVRIVSPRGSIKMKARVTDRIMKGVVSLPHGWPGDANVNILVDDNTLDPISGFPPFKSQMCNVIKVS